MGGRLRRAGPPLFEAERPDDGRPREAVERLRAFARRRLVRLTVNRRYHAALTIRTGATGTAAEPKYPETAYGFMRFTADIGRTWLVGFDRLNPQLQERVIPNFSNWHKRGKPWKYDKGKPAADGARNHSARPVDK